MAKSYNSYTDSAAKIFDESVVKSKHFNGKSISDYYDLPTKEKTKKTKKKRWH